MKTKTLSILKKVQSGDITIQVAQEQLFVLFGVSGSLHDAPAKIFVNVYNPIKPNSWDCHLTEASAVINSIGAKTHCYIHESLLSNDR